MDNQVVLSGCPPKKLVVQDNLSQSETTTNVSRDQSGVSAWCSQFMNNKLLRFDQTNMLKK